MSKFCPAHCSAHHVGRRPAQMSVVKWLRLISQQEKFEDRWQASVANRLIDAAAATRAEETAAVRAADEAAQVDARTLLYTLLHLFF